MSGRADYLRKLLKGIMARSRDPRDAVERERIERAFRVALRGNGEKFLDEILPFYFAAHYRILLRTDFPLPPGTPVARSEVEKLADQIEHRRVLEQLRAMLA